jgi:uncharacterized protein YndB with AHSA1/START domain
MAENEMPNTNLRLEREYDLPPSIVWDALVDDVLVDGWLAPARIDPRVGGRYLLNWQSGATLAPTHGEIRILDARRRLVVDTDNIGTLDFTLESVEGGSRGAATILHLDITVDTDPRMLATTIAYWESNFDQLEDLLRGHPVDWSTWQRDRGEAWERYRRASSSGA